ncbi:Pimeloyl-ACP methyl ester carboxylesterase [Thermomonospora echinospora]|uniref:Pimeloyl-ACP methyl ester carboxylesterase n=1 Tax=Thermomonospora echinospora TaxID=1992 RepID=A0A1H6AKX4_9ACTN|nr:alpha/beta fold hydrolase [Thermomonospora echinospora]SEG48880.1 Pimeloyl-ACP methyl ester carboxylesterase [Thermomonospora echinospora]
MEPITARDGASIALHSTGSGPGIVVVHGGGVTIGVYRRLAAALADRFTVHLYNRRGRADAPPRSEPYTFEQDIDDLAVVLEHTGARNVIGHSSGGFIALQAALRLPMDRLALYDAAISIDGVFPAAWLEAAREALRAGDTARGLAITSAGINTQSAAAKLPLRVRTAICGLFLRTPIGRTMGDLLPMTLDETELIRAHDGPADQWAGVTAEVLLACGADGPPYYVEVNEALAHALPRVRTLQIPRSGHDAINRARPRLVNPLAEFFTTPATRERAGRS